MSKTYITSLDAFWQTEPAPAKTRVDLLARYMGARLAAEVGRIELADPNPLVIIYDAILSPDRTWLYQNADGVDVPIPAACQVKAWRPAAIRLEAYDRADEIDGMLALLTAAKVIDPHSHRHVISLCRTLRTGILAESDMVIRPPRSPMDHEVPTDTFHPWVRTTPAESLPIRAVG